MKLRTITLAFVAVAAASTPSVAQIDVEILPCEEPVPAAIGIPGLTGGMQDLRVHVLLDGVDPSRAETVMRLAAERSYASLGIRLVVTAQTVSFSGNDAEGLIQQAKAKVRPSGVHIVHVLTSKDIVSLGNPVVAGLADCIGGVRFPDRSYSVAEVNEDEGTMLGPLTLDFQTSAKVTAHEIGHLMGAHHHYANCVEGILSEVEPGEVIEVSPCTLMFNVVNPSSFNFSGLAGAVVRGYAEEFTP